MEIGNTGNYRLLLKEGNATVDQCQAKWEEIIKESAKAVGNYEYMNYIDDLQSLKVMLQEFLFVRGMLLSLFYVVDDRSIKDLRDRGYHIDTSNRFKYVDSLATALQSSKNLVSRIRSKIKKLEKLAGKPGGSLKGSSYDEIVGSLVMALGISIDESTLTVARYNFYRKQIEERNSKLKANGGRNK